MNLKLSSNKTCCKYIVLSTVIWGNQPANNSKELLLHCFNFSNSLANQQFVANCLYFNWIVVHQEECLSAKIARLFKSRHESKFAYNTVLTILVVIQFRLGLTTEFLQIPAAFSTFYTTLTRCRRVSNSSTASRLLTEKESELPIFRQVQP